MGEDEEHALILLGKNKEIHEKYFLRYHSTYFKQIGDGFLAIFDSVLEATYACGYIQKECKENNINIRIGINQGEVIFKDRDVFGDDVNIASRIESAAEKGAIFVSENVKKILENKTGISVEFIRYFKLKNVKDPIDLYAVEVDMQKIPSISSVKPKPFVNQLINKRWFRIAILILLLGIVSFFIFRNDAFIQLLDISENKSAINLAEKSIAVLPFQNFSNDSTMDYLGDGFADHIIINLSKIPDFSVIARSSSFRFKKSDKAIREIAQELGVQNILEGSFQTINDDIHINLNLFHGTSGEVLYAASYDGRFSELFQLQDDVAESFTNSLVGSFLKFHEPDRKEEEISLQAFKYYQYGQSLLKENYIYRNTILESREQFRLASVEDPNWSAPYVGMAESYFMELHYGYKTFRWVKDSIEYFVDKASSLNPEQGELYCVKGTLEYWKYDFKKALNLYSKAIELNPNYPFSYYYLAYINLGLHKYEDTFANINKAISLDPLNETFKTMKPMFLSFSNRNEEAINICMEMLEEEPGKNTTLFILGLVYSNMKEYEKALNTLSKRSVGHNTNFLMAFNYAKTGQKEKARQILDYLLQLSDDRAPPSTQFVIVYLGLEEYENAFAWIQKGLEMNDIWYIWLEQSWADPIKNDPRFIEIMDSINLKYN